MATLLLILLLCAYYSPGAAQQSPLNISLGSSLTLTGNSSWLSPSGLYAFGFYQQGDGYSVGIILSGIPQRTVVWTANRDNPIVPINVTLVLSNDGRLILQQTQGQDIYIANPSESIASASMLDSGNFVLYNSAQNIIWQSFEHPTDTLLPGQRLSTGQELFSSGSATDSSRGIFRLKMQADGNLVQYPVGTPDSAFPYGYWTSLTEGQGSNVTLNLENDGHLYLLSSNFTIIKNLTDGGFPKNGTIYRARVDVDGIFRLYSHSLDRGNWSIRWESTTNYCDPKGLCGLNGFCTIEDTEVDCRCIPGFDFVSQGNWTSGCERNFTVESCKLKSEKFSYAIRSLVNTQWENDPSEVLEATIQEDCENACLADCNCEAALFRDRQCRKQRLPLRYGKRSPDSTIALIKVGRPVDVPSNLPKTIKKEMHMDILIIGISLTVFGGLICILAGVYVLRNKLSANKNISRDTNIEFIENVAPRAFTFAELEQATHDFQEELGRGAFGAVYKGILPNSQKVVAVKRLEKILEEGEIEFQNEVLVIGKTHHRNLVRLLGYCIDGSKRLLVYEYMSNGSLADILFTPGDKPSWDDKLKIATQIARGILYLHEECETQIIHCDIKPQNILMDEKRCAKISDFGLAKLLKHEQTKTYTAMRGTKGYVAPEWHRKLPVTVKADVYSFGIVLLEIICCRKNIDWSFPEDQSILEEWAYDCFEAKELHKLVMDEQVDMRKLERVIKIAIWCIQDDPALRPSMKKVLLMLEGTVDIPIPPSPISFLSST